MARLAGYSDFHSHLVPGVDDGSRTPGDAVHSVERMVEAGITRMITTPHFPASVAASSDFAGYLAFFDHRWSTLRDAVRERHPRLDLRRGFEIRLDVLLPHPLDERLRLGGTHFVLVEWPRFQVHPGTTEMLARIAATGLTPIVAHPERYSGIDRGLEVVRAWRNAGALLQGNYGSLAGQNGPGARNLILQMLREGLLDYLCSDFHGRPEYTLYFERGAAELKRLGGGAQLELLGKVNPGRLFDGRRPLCVPPVLVKEPRTDHMLGQPHG